MPLGLKGERQMASSPGDHVRWFAGKQGWKIRRFNVMTEGDTDCRYFALADKVYNAKHRQRLITDELAIFPVGTGSNGGALKIAEVFPTFHQLIERDLGENSQILFRTIALMDDDPVGREAYKSITARSVRIRGGRDVFLLARSFPRNERMPGGYNAAIVSANRKWMSMHCEIEDLLPVELIQQFLKSNGIDAGTCLRIGDGGHHVELDMASKAKLLQSCERNADMELLRNVIETLKSIRFYLGMPVPEN